MLMSVSGSLGSILLVRGSSGELTTSPGPAQERRVRAEGAFPCWLRGCWIRPCGELAISFLALAGEHKGKSNAVSCVTVKNTR